MNRKLLIVQIITVILLALLAVFINFLTNDKNILDSLSSNGIGTNKIFGIVGLITIVLVVLEYIKLHDDKTELEYNQSAIQYPASDQQAFNEVWQCVIELEYSADALWERVSNAKLADFTAHYKKASELVRKNALFFPPDDYQKLTELLKVANFYYVGKNGLLEIRLSDILNDKNPRDLPRLHPLYALYPLYGDVKHQIQQNKRWLSRYKNLLSEIRNSLHNNLKQNSRAGK